MEFLCDRLNIEKDWGEKECHQDTGNVRGGNHDSPQPVRSETFKEIVRPSKDPLCGLVGMPGGKCLSIRAEFLQPASLVVFLHIESECPQDYPVHGEVVLGCNVHELVQGLFFNQADGRRAFFCFFRHNIFPWRG